MAILPAFDANAHQFMDNALNYAAVLLFSTFLNHIYLPSAPLAVMLICKKTSSLNFYANTHFRIMHMKQQLSSRQSAPLAIFHSIKYCCRAPVTCSQQTCLCLWVCVSSLSHGQHAILYNTRRHIPLSLLPDWWRECNRIYTVFRYELTSYQGLDQVMNSRSGSNRKAQHKFDEILFFIIVNNPLKSQKNRVEPEISDFKFQI